MSAPAYTALGKEVLRDGEHYVDAVSADDAEIIAAALNMVDSIGGKYVATPRPTDTERLAS